MLYILIYTVLRVKYISILKSDKEGSPLLQLLVSREESPALLVSRWLQTSLEVE